MIRLEIEKKEDEHKRVKYFGMINNTQEDIDKIREAEGRLKNIGFDFSKYTDKELYTPEDFTNSEIERLEELKEGLKKEYYTHHVKYTYYIVFLGFKFKLNNRIAELFITGE